MTTGAPLLAVKGLTKNFGGVRAVDKVSFEVERGSIVGLIGPNGAGKTTTFNLISGRFAPSAGTKFVKPVMLPPGRARLATSP